jgi:hephaestin
MREFTPQLSAKSKLQALDFDEDGGAVSLTGHGFADGNLKFTINGYLYGEGPDMTMRRGERVRWYVISLGNGFNLHTPHWHGNTVLFQGHRTDVLNIGAAQMLEADMVPDNPGTWLFHCHYSDHMAAGMLSFYKVL